MMNSLDFMNILSRRTVMLLAALGLGACVVSPAKTLAPAAAWIFPLHEDGRLTYDGEVNAPTVSAAGCLVFTTKAGLIYAVDPASKKILWRHAAKAPILVPPSVLAGSVVAADQEGVVYALDLEGKLRWEKKLEMKPGSAPCQDAGRILIAGGGTALIALDSAKGAEIWRFKVDGTIATPLALWNGRVLFGTEEGKIFLVRGAGAVVTAETAFSTGGPVRGPLFVDADRLYCSPADGTVQCFSLRARKRLWTVKTGGVLTSLPAADNRRIYFTVSSQVLFCLDKSGGDLLWWHALPARGTCGPAVDGDTVFAAAFSPVLSAFKAKTGEAEKSGTFDAGRELRSGPLRAGEVLVIHGYDPDSSQGVLFFLKGVAPKGPEPKKK